MTTVDRLVNRPGTTGAAECGPPRTDGDGERARRDDPIGDELMLQIVAKNDAPIRRLMLARRHIETAISHINDVAQSRIPTTTGDLAPGVDELRLIVRALADIREALKSSDPAIVEPPS
ncbi:MAG TPA: hypothetical protein VGF24_10310 [Vicinamibacterales bacterium]